MLTKVTDGLTIPSLNQTVKHMYTISFHENGKPFTLPGIPSQMVLNHLIKVLFKGAIEGTFNISHLTTIKHS